MNRSYALPAETATIPVHFISGARPMTRATTEHLAHDGRRDGQGENNGPRSAETMRSLASGLTRL